MLSHVLVIIVERKQDPKTKWPVFDCHVKRVCPVLSAGWVARSASEAD